MLLMYQTRKIISLLPLFHELLVMNAVKYVQLFYQSMVCDIILRKVLRLPVGETVPTPSELQDMVGAKDHEEFHAIIEGMDENELEELRRKIAMWRKKKFGISGDYIETTPVS